MYAREISESVRNPPTVLSGKTLQVRDAVVTAAPAFPPFPYAYAGYFPTVTVRRLGYDVGMSKRMTAGLTIALGLAAGLGVAPLTGQLPFGPGEELVFKVQSSRFGKIGTAVMRVTADTIRGRDVFLLAFDFSAKVVLFKASDQTRSWFDPSCSSSLRYSKRERSPVAKRDEKVEIFPEERRWQNASGPHASETTQPLDELSFLYYLRTLPLAAGVTYTVHRHFDPARNPVTIKVVRRERLEDVENQHVFQAIVVEMRVRDSRQSKGFSVLRLHVTDDALKVPVRIESAMALGGTMVMTLQARLVK